MEKGTKKVLNLTFVNQETIKTGELHRSDLGTHDGLVAKTEIFFTRNTQVEGVYLVAVECKYFMKEINFLTRINTFRIKHLKMNEIIKTIYCM